MACKKLLVVLLSAAAVFTVEAACPDASRIAPCYCELDDNLAVATCSNLQNVQDLSSFIPNSDGYPYKEVRIEDSTIDSIPVSLLESVKTQSLVLRNTNLKQMFDGIPRTLPSLKTMTLQSLTLEEDFDWKYFQYTRELQTLLIDHVDIPRITPDFNKYVTPNLQKVSFAFTKTDEIQPDAMLNMRNLQSITVAHNNLRTLYRGCLPKPFNGLLLDFQYNKLTELREDVFTDMPNVKTVYFTNNEIAMLNRPSEAGVIQRISVIDLTNNPIDCSCHLKWVPEDKPKGIVGKCASPQPLRGKQLVLLSATDFTQCNTQ